jgi:hypothetical protein
MFANKSHSTVMALILATKPACVYLFHPGKFAVSLGVRLYAVAVPVSCEHVSNCNLLPAIKFWLVREKSRLRSKLVLCRLRLLVRMFRALFMYEHFVW